MEEGGEEDVEREEGEEGGACWRRPNLGRHCPGRGCERQRLFWRGRWLHQAEGTPARRQEEEATRAAATRFFFYSWMRGKESLLLLLFFCSFCLCRLQAEEQRGEASSAGQGQEAVKIPCIYVYICHDREAVECNMSKSKNPLRTDPLMTARK
jgi:hypothetical protein